MSTAGCRLDWQAPDIDETHLSVFRTAARSSTLWPCSSLDVSFLQSMSRLYGHSDHGKTLIFTSGGRSCVQWSCGNVHSVKGA